MAGVLKKHTKMVNAAIESMGIDPKVCADEQNDNVWKLHRGEAQMILVLQESNIYGESIVPTISMMSPVLKATTDSEKRLKLYQNLLEINHKLTTETFSVSNGWVVLSATYYIEDMTIHELRQMLESISYHAQYFLEQMK